MTGETCRYIPTNSSSRVSDQQGPDGAFFIQVGICGDHLATLQHQKRFSSIQDKRILVGMLLPVMAIAALPAMSPDTTVTANSHARTTASLVASLFMAWIPVQIEYISIQKDQFLQRALWFQRVRWVIVKIPRPCP